MEDYRKPPGFDAQQFMDRVCGRSRWADMVPGTRLEHPDDGLVEITSGQYWGTHGLSNSWSWRKVMPDGTLHKEEKNGYGW